MLSALKRRATGLAREHLVGAPRELRIAAAKRRYELELRAAGLTRKQAKVAVSVRFGREATGDG